MKVEIPKAAITVEPNGTIVVRDTDPRGDRAGIVRSLFAAQDPITVSFLSAEDAQLQHGWTAHVRKEGHVAGLQEGVRQERQRILALRDMAFAGVPLDDDMKKCLRRFDELLLRGWTTS